LSTALVASLRAAGHDVSYVAEVASGMTDEEVLKLAQDEQRVFLTEDKDFGELIFRFRLPAPGLVLASHRCDASVSQVAPAASRGHSAWRQAVRTLCRHYGNPVALACSDVTALAARIV
jgi:predicted nuclease of predicted toxin-antitoxin system